MMHGLQISCSGLTRWKINSIKRYSDQKGDMRYVIRTATVRY